MIPDCSRRISLITWSFAACHADRRTKSLVNWWPTRSNNDEGSLSCAWRNTSNSATDSDRTCSKAWTWIAQLTGEPASARPHEKMLQPNWKGGTQFSVKDRDD